MNLFPQIDILMATYNGEKYIQEQITSILQQSYTNWRLIIKDDGSIDNTVMIVEEYQKKYPDKIEIVQDKTGLGACQNFASLLNYSNANYTMFCDQDDIWLPQKIELTLQRMLEMESKYKALPLLVHTDLFVVDQNLNILSNSFWDYQNLDACQAVTVNYLLAQNTVTGCTIMINNHLKQMIHYIPKGVIMHDWWLALVAATFGKIGICHHSTVLYRQHTSNDTGAKKWSYKYISEKLFFGGNTRKSIEKTILQAKLFLKVFGEIIEPKTLKLIKCYSELKDYNILKRKISILRYKYYKSGCLRTLGFLIYI